MTVLPGPQRAAFRGEVEVRFFRASVRPTEVSSRRSVRRGGHIDQRIEKRCGDTDQEHRDIGQFSGAARLTWRQSRARTLTLEGLEPGSERSAWAVQRTLAIH
jgi:hypothetical protein